MPQISRTFIKTGFLFFILSLLAGVAIEIDVAVLPSLTPLFWHMLMLGWITQIIFGVSMWMFPGRNREEGFRAQKWGWHTYLFLNTGLLLRLIAEPSVIAFPAGFWEPVLVASGLLQMLAGITYVIEMWNRVQSKEKIIRQRKQQSKS